MNTTTTRLLGAGLLLFGFGACSGDTDTDTKDTDSDVASDTDTDSDADSDTDTDSDADSDADSDTDSDTDADTSDTAPTDIGNCTAYCAVVDGCGPASYQAVGGEYTNEQECVVFCETQYAEFAANNCGDEYAAIQACLVAEACPELVAFLNDPATAGVCLPELQAVAPCAP